MAEISQSRRDLSQVELLLDQQRYEEALAPLARLIEENPSDLQFRVYRLLTVRIMLLRETLAQGISQSVQSPRALAHRISFKTLNDFFDLQPKQWVQSVRHAIASSRPTEVGKRAALAIGVGAIFVTSVTFCLGVAEQQISRASESSSVLNKPSIAAATRPELDKVTPEVLTHRDSSGSASDQLPRLGRIDGDRQAILTHRAVVASPNSELVSKLQPALVNSTPTKEPSVSSKQRANGKSSKQIEPLYRTRGSLSLRQEPRFAAASLQQLAEGTRINVLGVNGNWLKVKTSDSNAVGYVRKEFLVAANGR